MAIRWLSPLPAKEIALVGYLLHTHVRRLLEYRLRLFLPAHTFVRPLTMAPKKE